MSRRSAAEIELEALRLATQADLEALRLTSQARIATARADIIIWVAGLIAFQSVAYGGVIIALTTRLI